MANHSSMPLCNYVAYVCVYFVITVKPRDILPICFMYSSTIIDGEKKIFICNFVSLLTLTNDVTHRL